MILPYVMSSPEVRNENKVLIFKDNGNLTRYNLSLNLWKDKMGQAYSRNVSKAINDLLDHFRDTENRVKPKIPR